MDCSKCYERVSHKIMQEQVDKQHFPAFLANMALDIYSGDRWVKVGEAVAEKRRATAGIMPGCGLAVALLKAYMRLGAKICGEPCWDPDFQVADLFILLKRDELCPRYARHFKAAV